MSSKLLSVQQLSSAHPAFSEASLRWLIFKSAENGLDKSGALQRIGRKVLIDEPIFISWIQSKNR